MTERPLVGYTNEQTIFRRCDVCMLQQLEPATITLQEISRRFQGSEIKIDLDNQSETLTIPKTNIFERKNYIRYQITDSGLEVSKRLGRKNKEIILSCLLERTMEI